MAFTAAGACEYGRCDHFTVGEGESERDFYVTTEFYRCSPLYPVRSYIATGGQIVYLLPEISARSARFACGRSCAVNLCFFGFISACLGTFLLSEDTRGWWFCVPIWMGVFVLMAVAVICGTCRQQASPQDRAVYLRMIGRDWMIRRACREVRPSDAEAQAYGEAVVGDAGPRYSERSPLIGGHFRHYHAVAPLAGEWRPPTIGPSTDSRRGQVTVSLPSGDPFTYATTSTPRGVTHPRTPQTHADSHLQVPPPVYQHYPQGSPPPQYEPEAPLAARVDTSGDIYKA